MGDQFVPFSWKMSSGTELGVRLCVTCKYF